VQSFLAASSRASQAERRRFESGHPLLVQALKIPRKASL
jgi:hypothetical protein